MSRKRFNTSWVSNSLGGVWPGGNGFIILTAFLTAVGFFSTVMAVVFAKIVGILVLWSLVLVISILGGFFHSGSSRSRVWPILAGILIGIVAGTLAPPLSNLDSILLDYAKTLRP